MLKNLLKVPGVNQLNKLEQKQTQGGKINPIYLCRYYCEYPDPSILCNCIFA